MAEFKIGRIRFVWRGVWVTAYDYVKDDVIRVGGSSFVCITGHTSGVAFAGDSLKWEKMQEGILFRNAWTPTTIFETNDIVVYGGVAYIVTTAHTSTSTFDISKFDTLVKGFDYKGAWTDVTLYKLNDLVKFGPNIYLCSVSHTSAGAFNLANFQLFVPGLEFEDGWNAGTNYQPGDIATYGGYVYISKTIHTNAVPSTSTADWDILTTGFNLTGVWSSAQSYRVGDLVQYGGNVYEAILDNINFPATNVTYWELLVEGLSFVGSWASGTAYRIGQVVSYGSSTYRVKLDHTSANSGNLRPDLDITGVNYQLLSEGDSNYVTINRGDLITRSAVANTRIPIGADGTVLRSDGTDPIWTYINELDFVYYVSTEGTDALDYGRTLDKPWRTVAYACANVNNDSTSIPATIFVKTGTYQEILPIVLRANVSLVGDELRTVIIEPAATYETADMFHVRDGSNIRNITLSGLTNSLTAALPSGTQRTLNSFVSLDPGTGPSDASVHISNKSPYIQNVTTFGTGVCGLKIDGTLHNAGNRSIVANDFTQILDNGIGVWVNGQGRAELVSVFTYFNYISNLATLGGTVRGVNGNSSYGVYGAVSEDGDPTEVPAVGTVDNRRNEAQIGTVLAGGDQIVILEIENGGEAYTSAAVTITGNGGGASATPVIANGVISRVDVVTRGVGHVLRVNNAQTGTVSQITLGVVDTATTGAYVGMRITLIDGTGYGQTAIIATFNGGTKVATVVKEDATPGWDQLISGQAIETALNETTRYRIEPRVTLSGGTAPSLTARLRAVVEADEIIAVHILDGGVGYNVANLPAIVFTDPNAATLATAAVNQRNGAIRSFTYASRGSGYTFASALITGDGFADIAQVGGFLNVNGLSQTIRPGSNLSLAGDGITYRCVAFTEQVGAAPNIQGRIRIAPFITVAPAQGVVVTITELYSNLRLSSHDFLSIGTGGTGSTNYPGIPATPAVPANEIREFGGGRVFFTSTDQDGNFKVGTLFKVEQATGIATLNADAFNLSGLNELQLGSVALGGSGVAIREFSADPLLTANSDFIVPTQRAVRTFVENVIGAGGSNLAATSLTLGGMVLSANQILATGANDLVMDCQGAGNTVVFNKIPTTSVAPTSGVHITNKTYTDFTFAPTIQQLTLNLVTGDLQYQEEHADTAITVTNSDNEYVINQSFVGQLRSSIEINAAGHLIINM